MPREFVPKRLGLHRQAAIALYRALLSQCRAVPFAEEQRNALQNIVQNRFRANRDLRGPRRIYFSFTAGYTAIDHLDGSVAGNVESIDRIEEYILRAPTHLKRPPKKKPPPKPDPNIAAMHEPPPEYKFLNMFPRPTVKGKRKVPFLVSANQLPFIRWKKPQPANVSRVLRSLRDQRDRRFLYKFDLENYFIPLAQYEDEWDKTLVKEFGREMGLQDLSHDSWESPMQELLVDVWKSLTERHERTKEMTQIMTDIVRTEAELAKKEKDERFKAAWEERQAKRAALGKAASIAEQDGSLFTTESDAPSGLEKIGVARRASKWD